MRKKFIITGLISLLILGWQLTAVVRNYYLGNEKLMTRIDQMQRLQLFSRTGIAMYDNAYVTTHKIGDKYTFTVYGKPYYHQVEMANPPQTERFEVQYLPDNPNVQAIDPSKQLVIYRQQLIEKQEAPAYSWVLIFAGLIGVIYSTYRVIKN
jgi:hypothetical protein